MVRLRSKVTINTIFIFTALTVIICFLYPYALERFKINWSNIWCPKEHILSAEFGGALGNAVWEYMSLFATLQLFKNTNLDMIAYAPAEMKIELEKVFERLSIPSTTIAAELCLSVNSYNVSLNAKFPLSFANDKTPILLQKYSSRYDDIIDYGIENIKKELRFKTEHVKNAMTTLKKIKIHTKMKNKDVTFVGVHYRGTDYTSYLERTYNITVNNLSLITFYRTAMQYYTDRYKNVIFIFISVDKEWLNSNILDISKDYTVVINPNGVEDRVKDLVLLSHCNHSIMNYGTFGATAALLAQGTTIVYDLKIPLDHRGATVAMGISHILPNWILL